MIDRRRLLAGAPVAAAGMMPAMAPAFAATRAGSRSAAKKPNIIFFLADDLGYADLGCFGSSHIRTPHLDQLAAQGMRFTDAYAAAPVCSPTRLALMTGRYHQRLPAGLIEPFRPGPWGESAIPPGDPTFAKLLRDAGYATALIGKWHLGPTPAGSPQAHGYEEFFGFLGGGIDYFTHEYARGKALRRGSGPVEVEGYMTTLLADEAIKVVEKQSAAQRPFCISLHFNAPHWPWKGPEDSQLGTEGFHFDGGSLDIYAQMVESMDRNIGRVLRALDNAGVAEDTLVVFTSDNGAERFSQTWPYRGEKGYLLEGGIRVPAIMRFPGRVAAGTSSAQPIITMDWATTMLDAAGLAPPKPAWDGVSLLSATDMAALRNRPLFWRFQGHRQRAVRVGQWKYFKLEDNEFLYDLSVDSLEKANRAAAEPQVLVDLKARWDAWNREMVSDESFPGYCLPPDKIAGELPNGPGTNCAGDATKVRGNRPE